MTKDELADRLTRAAIAATEGDGSDLEAIATELTTGKYASPCFVKAVHDENIFVLRATDPHTPATIEYWASRYRRANATMDEDLLQWVFNSPEAKAKYDSAMALAMLVEKSQAKPPMLQVRLPD
jgi:hypothetical protein